MIAKARGRGGDENRAAAVVMVEGEERIEWRGKRLRRKWEESWKLLMAGFRLEVGQFSEEFQGGVAWKRRHGDAGFAVPTAADRSCGGSRSLGTALGRSMTRALLLVAGTHEDSTSSRRKGWRAHRESFPGCIGIM